MVWTLNNKIMIFELFDNNPLKLSVKELLVKMNLRRVSIIFFRQ